MRSNLGFSQLLRLQPQRFRPIGFPGRPTVSSQHGPKNRGCGEAGPAPPASRAAPQALPPAPRHGRGRSPGGVEQRVLGAHQLADLHGDVAELVAQQAPQAHEGRRVPHDLLGFRHHLAPGRGRRRAAPRETPPASAAAPAPQQGPPHPAPRRCSARLGPGRRTGAALLRPGGSHLARRTRAVKRGSAALPSRFARLPRLTASRGVPALRVAERSEWGGTARVTGSYPLLHTAPPKIHSPCPSAP